MSSESPISRSKTNEIAEAVASESPAAETVFERTQRLLDGFPNRGAVVTNTDPLTFAMQEETDPKIDDLAKRGLAEWVCEKGPDVAQEPFTGLIPEGAANPACGSHYLWAPTIHSMFANHEGGEFAAPLANGSEVRFEFDTNAALFEATSEFEGFDPRIHFTKDAAAQLSADALFESDAHLAADAQAEAVQRVKRGTERSVDFGL